jgi:hypothetical protein
MVTHRRSACAAHQWEQPRDAPRLACGVATRFRSAACALVPAWMLLASCAQPGYSAEVETEHLFGFTIGSSIGEKGEKELESETTARAGKGTGTYAAVAQQFEAKYTAESWVRIAPAAVFAYHDISGVPELIDRRQAAFQGLSFDARFMLVDRERAPFGLMLSVEPHWNGIDDVTGQRVENYGGTLLLAADRELVSQKLYAALNILYDPEATRVVALDQWVRQSMLGLSGAVALQIRPGLFLGAEICSLQLYDGLGLDRFAGRALFAGPTFYAALSKHWWASFAWNVQLVGHVADRPSALDLVNFERYQAKIRFGYHF